MIYGVHAAGCVLVEKMAENRLKSYKTKGLDVSEVRRRREEEGVQLRRSRREEQVRAAGSETPIQSVFPLHVLNNDLSLVF